MGIGDVKQVGGLSAKAKCIIGDFKLTEQGVLEVVILVATSNTPCSCYVLLRRKRTSSTTNARAVPATAEAVAITVEPVVFGLSFLCLSFFSLLSFSCTG